MPEIAAEEPLPEPMAQHHDMLAPGAVLARQQAAAEQRGHAERAEEPAGHAGARERAPARPGP